MVVLGLLVLFGGVLAWIGALRQVRLVRSAPPTRPGSAVVSHAGSGSGPRRGWRLHGPRLPGWLGGTVLALGAVGFAVAAVDARSWPHALVALGLVVAAAARLMVWLRSRPAR